MQPVLGVVLPDGRFDQDGIRFADEADKAAAEPVIWPKVSDNAAQQADYEDLRVMGQSHVAALFSAFWGNADDDDPGRAFLVHARRDSVMTKYVEMRLGGQSHNMAEMLATRSFPGLKTDSIFNQDKFSGSGGRIDVEERWLREKAERAGVSTNGKWYCRGLASYPGDPTAWIGDRGDMLRVAREKNLTLHGYVEHKAHETDGGGDVPIASDIVENEVHDIMEGNPFANVEEVREQVTNMRSGAVDNSPLHCQDYFTTDIP